jgi:hypothetical protein
MKKKRFNTKNASLLKTQAISKALKVLNGCGGNKGTKCGVEVYYLPEDSKLAEITA